MRKALGRVYHTERAFVIGKRLEQRPLDADRAAQAKDVWDVREASRPEILGFAQRTDMTKKVLSYLGRGDRCFIAFDQREPIGMVWWLDGTDFAQRGHGQVDRFGIELGADEAYAYDLYLIPGKRGGGVATAFFAAFEEALRARGYTTLYGFVDEDNLAARWLYRLRRFETERVATSRVALGWLRFTDGRAYMGPERDYRRVRLALRRS